MFSKFLSKYCFLIILENVVKGVFPDRLEEPFDAKQWKTSTYDLYLCPFSFPLNDFKFNIFVNFKIAFYFYHLSLRLIRTCSDGNWVNSIFRKIFSHPLPSFRTVIMIYLQFIFVVTELLFITVVTSITTSLIEQNALHHVFCQM